MVVQICPSLKSYKGNPAIICAYRLSVDSPGMQRALPLLLLPATLFEKCVVKYVVLEISCHQYVGMRCHSPLDR